MVNCDGRAKNLGTVLLRFLGLLEARASRSALIFYLSFSLGISEGLLGLCESLPEDLVLVLCLDEEVGRGFPC